MATVAKTVVRPLEDRVLVKPVEAEAKTKSGIFLPEGAKEKPVSGTIVAAGPGKIDDDGHRHPLTVKKGDTVLYGKYSGTEVDIDGVKHLIMRENELLGVVEN